MSNVKDAAALAVQLRQRALADDESAWDRRLEEVRELHGVWRRQGILTMVRQSLHRLALPARWFAQPTGERRLTDVLHMAELLQEASARHDSADALVQWLIGQARERLPDDDDRIVRLESDADMLQVVTVFGAKGLYVGLTRRCRPAPSTAYAAAAAARALHQSPSYDGRFDRHWGIGSYSRLVRDAAGPAGPALPLPLGTSAG